MKTPWQPKHTVTVVVAIAVAAVLTPITAVAATGGLVNITDSVHANQKTRVSANGSLSVDLRDATTGTWTKVDSTGALATAPVIGTTQELWSGNICSSAPTSGSPQVDVSHVHDVTVVLTGVTAGGADDLYVSSSANNYSAPFALITVPSGGSALRSYVVPGNKISVFCSGSSQPSVVAVSVYGRA